MTPSAAFDATMRALLDAAVKQPTPLTADALAALSGLTARQARRAAAGLILRELLVRREDGRVEVTEAAAAVVAGGPMPIRPSVLALNASNRRTLRARLWAAMRIQKNFTIASLLCVAARDETKPESNACNYVRALVKVGIVREQRRRANCEKRYALIRDLGPLAPVRNRQGGVRHPGLEVSDE